MPMSERQFYRWDTGRQRWRHEPAEVAIVIAAVALITALLAVVLVMR
jgi:hypothetical protein